MRMQQGFMEQVKSEVLVVMQSPERFTRLEDGWIKDAFLGFDWGPSSEEVTDFEDAQKYCADLGGRLPEVHELHSLVDFSKRDPAINTAFFADTKTDDWYWTATKLAGSSGSAWCVGFGSGNVNYDCTGGSDYVRPVRASQ